MITYDPAFPSKTGTTIILKFGSNCQFRHILQLSKLRIFGCSTQFDICSVYHFRLFESIEIVAYSTIHWTSCFFNSRYFVRRKFLGLHVFVYFGCDFICNCPQSWIWRRYGNSCNNLNLNYNYGASNFWWFWLSNIIGHRQNTWTILLYHFHGILWIIVD